jgi:N-acetylglucosamine-6-sulfatase
VPSFTADRGWRVPVVVESQVDAAEMNAAEDHRPKAFTTTLTGTGIRTYRWKYARYVDGDAELYDLAHDPNELHNLYGRPRYAGIQAELARVWADYRDCAGASCRKPLPVALQAGPRRLAAATRQQERGVEARYGVPAL